jgi:uncharacterized protein (TIGR02453 family)
MEVSVESSDGRSRKADPSRKAILDYLRGLRENNNREWFEANRTRYELARTAFQSIIGELIARFDEVDDLGGVAVKDCVFRINRDLRFSKDKTPYKTVMSALLGVGGRKSTGRSYYFHLEPDGQSMLAGGLWEPSPTQLGKIRLAIAEDGEALREIIQAPDFIRCFGGLEGESLKTAPQGYTKDHPDIDLLRKKQFMAVHRLDDEMASSSDLVSRALEVYRAMKPLELFIESALA